MGPPLMWQGIRSFGKVSLVHLSNSELLKNIVIFKFCSLKLCVNFITKHAFNPIIQHVMKLTAFPHFCAGQNVRDAESLALKLQKLNVRTIVDHSVEELEQLDAFKLNLENKIALIAALQRSPLPARDGLNYIPLKPTSLISPQLLENLTKILSSTTLNADSNPADLLSDEDKAQYSLGLSNLSAVISAARDSHCSILLDAEQSHRQPAIDAIARTLAQRFNSPGKPPVVYNTYQTYLKSSSRAIQRDLKHALDNNYVFALKLVRGAYMASETQRATRSGCETPLLPSKAAVDSNFDSNASAIIEEISKLKQSRQEAIAPYIFIATHNSSSVDNCINSLLKLGLSPNCSNIKFAQILGMSDHVTYALSLNQFNAFKLVCFGEFSQVYPWLIRRLQENQDIFGAMQSDRDLLNSELRRRMRFGFAFDK